LPLGRHLPLPPFFPSPFSPPPLLLFILPPHPNLLPSCSVSSIHHPPPQVIEGQDWASPLFPLASVSLASRGLFLRMDCLPYSPGVIPRREPTPPSTFFPLIGPIRPLNAEPVVPAPRWLSLMFEDTSFVPGPGTVREPRPFYHNCSREAFSPWDKKTCVSEFSFFAGVLVVAALVGACFAIPPVGLRFVNPCYVFRVYI